jgi:hypothetical protein
VAVEVDGLKGVQPRAVTATLPRRARGSAALRYCLLAALFATFALAAPASRAEAVSCYGNYCSGKDPETTGCSAGAYTVAQRDIWQDGLYRHVELRWSPTCKTNWARMNVFNVNVPRLPRYMWVTQPRTNYTQWMIANNSTYAWTAQIYSPSLCVFAGATLDTGATGTTACV